MACYSCKYRLLADYNYRGTVDKNDDPPKHAIINCYSTIDIDRQGSQLSPLQVPWKSHAFEFWPKASEAGGPVQVPRRRACANMGASGGLSLARLNQND